MQRFNALLHLYSTSGVFVVKSKKLIQLMIIHLFVNIKQLKK